LSVPGGCSCGSFHLISRPHEQVRASRSGRPARQEFSLTLLPRKA
jgi:phage protein U